MSKYIYIFDAGHGGIINGQYVTPGKRSPKFEDGSVLYEGVNNRRIVKECIEYLISKSIKCIDIVNSDSDVTLQTRVKRANDLFKTDKKLIYISIHSDATGDGIHWENGASGVSGYTSPGSTNSDKFCEIVIQSLQKELGTTVNFRTDKRDGDLDKEEKFYVLTNTAMPAILLELGFHTNYEEAKKIQTKEWSDKIKEALYQAILKWEAAN